MSAELMPLPSVLLTEQVFERARLEGITDIVPNPEQMETIGMLTGTGPAYLPDITILRDAKGNHWDVNFKNVWDSYHYHPVSELQVAERGLQIVSAGGLRQYLAESGKKLVELSLKDWDLLGQALTEAIENQKIAVKGHPRQAWDLMINALGWLNSVRLNDPGADSPARKRIRIARSLQPYIISRQPAADA